MRARRGVIVAVTAVALAGAAVGAMAIFASRSSLPKQVTYRGTMYMGVIELTQREANARLGTFRAGTESVDGQRVYVTGGRPAGWVALLRSDRHFAVYQLMR
jgi:hypothetical protein